MQHGMPLFIYFNSIMPYYIESTVHMVHEACVRFKRKLGIKPEKLVHCQDIVRFPTP